MNQMNSFVNHVLDDYVHNDDFKVFLFNLSRLTCMGETKGGGGVMVVLNMAHIWCYL